MQYMLMYYETDAELAKASDPDRADAYWAGWMAYIDAIQQSGAFVEGNGLQPPHTATTVRLQGSTRHVHDGPFADTKEHLGGYVIIEAASLDVALEWAARSPSSANGHTEVRPVMPPPSG